MRIVKWILKMIHPTEELKIINMKCSSVKSKLQRPYMVVFCIVEWSNLYRHIVHCKIHNIMQFVINVNTNIKLCLICSLWYNRKICSDMLCEMHWIFNPTSTDWHVGIVNLWHQYWLNYYSTYALHAYDETDVNKRSLVDLMALNSLLINT